jgi:hypothetical protein
VTGIDVGSNLAVTVLLASRVTKQGMVGLVHPVVPDQPTKLEQSPGIAARVTVGARVVTTYSWVQVGPQTMSPAGAVEVTVPVPLDVAFDTCKVRVCRPIPVSEALAEPPGLAAIVRFAERAPYTGG